MDAHIFVTHVLLQSVSENRRRARLGNRHCHQKQLNWKLVEDIHHYLVISLDLSQLSMHIKPCGCRQTFPQEGIRVQAGRDCQVVPGKHGPLRFQMILECHRVLTGMPPFVVAMKQGRYGLWRLRADDDDDDWWLSPTLGGRIFLDPYTHSVRHKFFLLRESAPEDCNAEIRNSSHLFWKCKPLNKL